MNGDTCLQSALTACSGCEPTVLNASQLHCLEKAFDTWVARAKGSRSIVARNRARLVFMLLRYTGAKLGEILELDDRTDFALAYRKVVLGNRTDEGKNRREVYLPESLHNELKQVIRNSDYASLRGVIFRLDQGYMRKIINNRADECGIPKPLANPNTLRRSQAVELLQDGMPLMVVQGLLGHHTANATANFLELHEEEQRCFEKDQLKREGQRYAARWNEFIGRISAIVRGDIQSRIELTTTSGFAVVAIASTKKVEAQGLQECALVNARFSPTSVMVEVSSSRPRKSVDNCYHGVVESIHHGQSEVEVVVLLDDGTCLNTTTSVGRLRKSLIGVDDRVWCLIDPFSVILTV